MSGLQRFRYRVVFIVMLLASSQLATIHTAYGKSFLWKVVSPTAIVYMLGSIHVGTPSMYPLPNALEQAYNQSDYLVLEVNESAIDPTLIQQRVLQDGVYQGGQTLKDHVDAALYHQLIDFLVKQHIPEQPFIKMKPGMLAINLSLIYMQQLGYSPELGVDMHFMNKANQQHKPILELESAQMQLDLLLGFSDDTLLLKHTMSELADMKVMTAKMVKYWKNGDGQALDKLVIEDPLKKNPEFLPFTKKLIFDRNVTMTKKIVGYLANHNTYFVIVGAGHLVGEKGIISLLRKKGFKPIQY